MKLRKIPTLLLVLPFVLACNPSNTYSSISSSSSQTSSSSSSSSLEESSSESSSSSSSSQEDPSLNLIGLLKELSKGIKLDVHVEEQYGLFTNNYYLQNTSKPKEFSLIQYKDQTKQEALLREYYTSLEGDFVYQTRLNVNNEYNYYKVYNPMTYEFFVWTDGYDNLFSLLNKNDFTYISKDNYSLNSDKVEQYSSYLSTLLYGNPGLLFSTFEIDFKGELTLTATGYFKGSANYSYNITATAIESGANTKMDYRSEPFEEVSDIRFETFLNDLRTNNYTAHIYEKDGADKLESVFYSNPDKVYYEVLEYKSGFYVNKDGLVQEVKKVGNNFYKVGQPMEGDITEVMPKFKLSRAVFDRTNKGYILKDGIEGDLSVFTILQTLGDELDKLTIAETDEGYEITNVCGTLTTKIYFTNIGATNVGFDEETVLEPISVDSWADVLDEEGYQHLVNVVGEQSAAIIPVPEAYTEWYQLSEEPEYAMLGATGYDSLEDDIYAYYLKLIDKGFSISEEEGINGGVVAYFECLDNPEETVIIEFLNYDGVFAILVYLESYIL